MSDFTVPTQSGSQAGLATDPPPFTASALALAILSLFTWWLPPVGGALALLALILSWIGARSSRVHPGRYVATMAPTATRVVASIGLVFAAGVLFLWLLIAAAVGAASGAAKADGDAQDHHRHAHEGHEGEDGPQVW